MRPPDEAISRAIEAAKLSPCAKSKRGVALFYELDNEPEVDADTGIRTHTTRPWIVATGQNSGPWPHYSDEPAHSCDGSATCRAMCRHACVHAEARAVLEFDGLSPTQRCSKTLQLVHVKVVDGELVAGGPPSCWPCANLLVEHGRVETIWLYEDLWEGADWTCWPTINFYRATMLRQGEHPRYEPRNGIEIACGDSTRGRSTAGCGKREGAKRDRRGFWRCIKCGYPSP